MLPVKCIIIEDEPLAVKVLADYIAQVPFLHLQGTFKDAILATDYLRHHNVDLLFLDIHLPKLKGMAFLKTLARPPAVIITDYLLKPFEFERFLVAVNKVKTNQSEKQFPAESSEQKDYLFLGVQKKKVKLLFADIVYVESQREYIKIVTTKKEYISKMSTHEIEALLPAHLFRRIHRSFIVSISKIESYTVEMVEVNGTSLPVGRSYRDSLENL
jgi:two-component system, LytTR family, response regulator